MSHFDKINVVAELDRLNVPWTWSGENEVRVKCPFHDDSNPSLCLNVKEHCFKCHVSSCGKSGDTLDLLSGFTGQARSVIYVELAKRYGITLSKPIEVTVVERWHQSLYGAKNLLDALTVRGVSETAIKRWRLGENEGRITIPIKDASGLYVDCLKYLPGAPGPQKMRHQKGRGKAKLYPLEQMRYNAVMLCGGPIKAVAACEQLNPNNIGAVCSTAGEQLLDTDLLTQFRGKIVYVCMDIDNAGKAASIALCKQLSSIAEEVYLVELPLVREKYPKGDVNDFIGVEGGDVYDVIKNLAPWSAEELDKDQEPTKTTLDRAVCADMTGKLIELTAVAAAAATSPYVIPKTVKVLCDRSLKECSICSVFSLPPDPHLEISDDSPEILEMVNSPKTTLEAAMKSAVGIPASCRVCKLEAVEHYSVEDLRISPQLEITTCSAERMLQPAVVLSEALELNEPYILQGRMYPHPATQQSTLLIKRAKPAQDALSSYNPTDLESLGEFQPNDWTAKSVWDKLNHVAEDYEANVTRIFQRRLLHLVIDLTYHSPLLLRFDGRVVKGWMESLVVGDSAQGKTETAMGLMQHFGLGEKVECKNATVAGLLGGLQQLGNKWYVTWGVIPTHDRRLVILEELKGANTEVIAKLTDMRSSGIAEIPKIERRKTHARTRLIALSNPRGNGQISTYSFGIQAIQELVGGLEDVRRFDLAIALSTQEIDASRLNKLQRSRPVVPHRYTTSLSRSLILWGWTRDVKQVHFEDDCCECILNAATSLCEKYTDAIPLLDRGSARNKLARIAAAIAVRTFSTPDLQRLEVKVCHAETAEKLVDSIYSSPVMGYLDYTSAIKASSALEDPVAVERYIQSLPYPRDFALQCLRTPKLDLQDIADWCSWDRIAAQNALSFLVRKHALQRDGRAYRKTPPFIAMLRSMVESKSLPEVTSEQVQPEF